MIRHRVSHFVATLALLFAAFALSSVPALAGPTSSCNASITVCNVFEGSVLAPNGYLGISGDIVLRDAGGAVSDVFRIFNNFFDSGGGTGLGISASIFSDDEHNLPPLFSVNAVFLAEGTVVDANGFVETDYNGNGTLYHIF